MAPNEWVGYLPSAATNLIPATILLKIFSVYELALVAWLLWGRYLRVAAVLAALTLTGIVLSNLGLLAISFRDIALIFAALALAVLAE